MIRKILSVVFYTLGGFFMYGICLIAFMNTPQVGSAKFYIMGGFTIPAVISFFIGAAISRFKKWEPAIGTALLTSVGFTLLVVITFICLLLSPEFEEFFPGNNLSEFDDYLSGVSTMFFLAILGGLLIKTNNKEIAEPGVQE